MKANPYAAMHFKTRIRNSLTTSVESETELLYSLFELPTLIQRFSKAFLTEYS